MILANNAVARSQSVKGLLGCVAFRDYDPAGRSQPSYFSICLMTCNEQCIADWCFCWGQVGAGRGWLGGEKKARGGRLAWQAAHDPLFPPLENPEPWNIQLDKHLFTG